MSDEPDDEFSNNDRFPLAEDDRPKILKLIRLVRSWLSAMTPDQIRDVAFALFALEQLPGTTAGVDCRISFVQPNSNGNFGWADIEISTNEFRLSVGEHFYDPRVGGDTESRTEFEAFAGSEWAEGDIDDWLSAVPNGVQIEIEDSSDREDIDLTNVNAASWWNEDHVVRDDDSVR